MTRPELIDAVAEKTGQSRKDVEDVLRAAEDTIAATLKKREKVTLTGFGTFEVRHRKARTGRNPQTGATIQIPGKAVPAFSAGKGLKDDVA